MFTALRFGLGRERQNRSLGAAVRLMIAFGAAGLFIQEPPIQPPGIFPRGVIDQKNALSAIAG